MLRILACKASCISGLVFSEIVLVPSKSLSIAGVSGASSGKQNIRKIQDPSLDLTRKDNCGIVPSVCKTISQRATLVGLLMNTIPETGINETNPLR